MPPFEIQLRSPVLRAYLVPFGVHWACYCRKNQVVSSLIDPVEPILGAGVRQIFLVVDGRDRLFSLAPKEMLIFASVSPCLGFSCKVVARPVWVRGSFGFAALSRILKGGATRSPDCTKHWHKMVLGRRLGGRPPLLPQCDLNEKCHAGRARDVWRFWSCIYDPPRYDFWVTMLMVTLQSNQPVRVKLPVMRLMRSHDKVTAQPETREAVCPRIVKAGKPPILEIFVFSKTNAVRPRGCYPAMLKCFCRIDRHVLHNGST